LTFDSVPFGEKNFSLLSTLFTTFIKIGNFYSRNMIKVSLVSKKLKFKLIVEEPISIVFNSIVKVIATIKKEKMKSNKDTSFW